MGSAVLGQALHRGERQRLTRPRGRVRRNARGAGDEKQRKDGGNLDSLLRKHEISLVGGQKVAGGAFCPRAKQALSTSCATGVRSVANWRHCPGTDRKGLCQVSWEPGFPKACRKGLTGLGRGGRDGAAWRSGSPGWQPRGRRGLRARGGSPRRLNQFRALRISPFSSSKGMW